MSENLINLKLAEHYGNKIILLKFNYNEDLKSAVKKIPDCKWSNSKKSFYINYRSDYKHYLLRFVDEKHFRKTGHEVKKPSKPLNDEEKIKLTDNKTSAWLSKFRQYLENK